MKKILRYGKHLLRAKGRHGTHSPFVYAFVEQVLRNKQRFHIKETDDLLSRKELNLLARAVAFLKPDRILAEPSLLGSLQRIVVEMKSDIAAPVILDKENLALADDGKTLLVAFANGNFNNNLTEQAIKDCNVFVLWVRPHADEVSEQKWYALSAMSEIRMRLDLWYLGLLVNDPAFKASQYFRLR